MRTMILALAFTTISLGASPAANETKVEVNLTSKNVHANYSSRMYAKRSIRNAKSSIIRAKYAIGNWGWNNPFRADLAEAIRHQRYAIDLYRWGDFYEAARNSDYAARIAEYVTFQAYDNGYCSDFDYFNGYNSNSGWFYGGNNGWGFGFGYNSNNGAWNNNNNWDNNGNWNNGGFDDDYYRKGKDNRKGGSQFEQNQGTNNNASNPRYNGGMNKPTMDQGSNPRNTKPSFDNSNNNPRMKPSFDNSNSSVPSKIEKPSNEQREDMKKAYEKMKADKPVMDDTKFKSKTDDEVLKSNEKLDIEQ
jgi:hypothetical protein